MDRESAIKQRYAVLTPMLDERSRRLLVAAESQVIGRSGITGRIKSDRRVSPSDSSRHGGVEKARDVGTRTSAARGRRAEKGDRPGSHLEARLGTVVGVNHEGRSGSALAVDVQKRAQPDHRTEAARALRQPPSRSRF